LSQRLLFAAVVLFAALVPATVYGQASIAGVASDASGAVLPGVTVEASSPVLIEGARLTVSDGSGRHRIESLRPGTHIVTFTLPGFSTVRREGIELVGSSTATVDADLRVGAVTETITVSGAAPTVDTRSIRQERVINRELLDTLPFGRTPQTAAWLTPGASAVSTFGAVEIGGTNIIMTGGGLTSVHGSRGGRTRC
jgi:Carboxypeptidase regulatory-like domain